MLLRFLGFESVFADAGVEQRLQGQPRGRLHRNPLLRFGRVPHE
jgi:hypothetical protein